MVPARKNSNVTVVVSDFLLSGNTCPSTKLGGVALSAVDSSVTHAPETDPREAKFSWHQCHWSIIMTFIVLHLNEPGRTASKVALAVRHISSVREVADDAGTEIRLSDGSIINVIEAYKAIVSCLANFGVRLEGCRDRDKA